MNKSKALKSYFVSIFFAMGLNIFSFPVFFRDYNPDWVLLTLIYWVLAIPGKVGVFNAWGVGLIVDVLTGRLLGQHALAYSLTAYSCLKLHKRLGQYLLRQQSLFIFSSLLLSKMIEFMIEDFKGDAQLTLVFLLPVVVGTFFWPVIYTTLRFFRSIRRIG